MTTVSSPTVWGSPASYAEVHLLLEPLPLGSGIELDTACSEDDLPGSWQRLIFTHLAERAHRGTLTGSALTDARITLRCKISAWTWPMSRT